MKTALIIGASGMIGTELTQLLLGDERYSKVNVLVRTPLEIQDEKLNQIRYNFDWPEAELVKGDELFCCLGTTIKKAGSQAAFRKVDYDYIYQTAKLSLENGIKKIVMVSSIGANINSKVFYSRIKGEIEAAISQLGFETCHILRPSLLLGSRSELRMGEIVGAFFSTAFSFAIPDKYKAIEASQVAKGMINSMNSEQTGVYIHESDDILSL
ncbi:MAG: oxidoreductase [Saprospiraceae bacterium]|nr:oxidoreductase [Saprospiraceae bacterium]